MKILFTIIFLSLFNLLCSEEVNLKLINDVDRLSKDVQDLQKFVYSNSENETVQGNSSDQSYSSSAKILDIENTLKNINSRLEELEIKISDLYSLYLNKNNVTLSNATNDDVISLEVESSNIISGKNENQLLGELNLNDIENEKVKEIDQEFKLNEIEINQSASKKDNPQKNFKTPFDVIEEMMVAKNYMMTGNNDSAIKIFIQITESSSDNNEVLSEAYYLLGRTYFLQNQFIEAVKYFGIRHRDFSAIVKFKTDNYFWLAKSLIEIGDKENSCLIIEEIIFSEEYDDQPGVTEDSKALQEMQGCGLIID
jgi:TolA-binding protein|tara:strand:+ start:627 stop:1559 length:933 start_codon:yes stop_codon:yes gene_type:complete